MSLLSRLAVQAARAYGALSAKGGVSASYLAVAGGGGGGCSNGGGGGAGGYRESTATLSTLNTYSIAVGAGGAGASTRSIDGSNGVDSYISGTGLTTITSTGGGGGGSDTSPATFNGKAGGSGGGGVGNVSSTGGAGNTPSTSPSQGSNGGAGANAAPNYGGGGGGGASAVGVAGTSIKGGNGGAGTASSISGSSVTYAGGGGAGSFVGTAGTGGAGGGGNGNSSGAGTAGTANFGGGGGGGSNASGVGGQGGSGIVIISYTSATPLFVGGTLTTINSGATQVHTFTSSGTLSPLTPVTASYLVVAGGGGGGYQYGGGGGAGGLLTSSTTLYSGATYIVTVGAGGAGATGTGANGVNGSNSVLSGTGITTITSTGGGGGAKRSTVGSAGGSGGGGAGDNSSVGGAGTSGQGFGGGTGSSVVGDAGGGGGGAGAVGASVVTMTVGGNGGIGVSSSISGTSTYYAGGGGGPGGTSNGTGGSGGGGAGNSGAAGIAGTTNTGGGGGGSYNIYAGGAGGSGTVIISYAGSQVFNGGLVTSSGGNTIHTFNATGALTPLTNNLNNSLRFRSSASAYLSKTLGTPTNSYIWTYSAWFKRGTLGVAQTLLEAWSANNNTQYGAITITSSDTLTVSGWSTAWRTTTQVFRDPSAWYHLVVAVDTTQTTGANRVKVYINGNQVTAFGTSNDPTQNTTVGINTAIAHSIGSEYSGTRYQYFDGYNADINFIDGQALEPYYFGNNDAYGNWKPIKYTGMYGTNGFYLTFSDTSAATAAAIGKDSSPNGNNWTPSGISVTAGVTYDAMTDVPTNTSATVANYCVNNPVDTSPAGGVNAITISGANLNLAGASTDWAACRATIGVTSGKWYWECTRTGASNLIFGIGLNSTTLVNAYSSTSYGYFSTGDKYSNNVSSAYGASFTSGDVIGVAFDADAGTLTFYKNNTSQGTAYTGLTSGPYFPLNQVYTTGSTASINFGQRPFSYTPPTGYVALNTYNLPTPTILQGNKYMDATLYTGTGVSQVLVNQGQFKPDFIWLKGRNVVSDHAAYDSVRGVTKRVEVNSLGVESTELQGVTAFNSNGVTIGTMAQINQSPYTFVGWQWQAGQGTTTTGTGTGGITNVTQSVSTTAGFSVVQFTASGSNGTVTHGLGVAPSVVIVKDAVSTGNWVMYHKSLPSAAYYLYMNTTAAQGNTALTWNSTAPTSSVFSIGTWHTADRQIAYCFAEIAGFSKFGSYTGNNSTDGPFVYLGFRPKFIMIKDATNVQSWNIIDSARVTYNVDNIGLYPNLTNAESANLGLDLLSNGFKFRTDGTTNGNASGATYIYMAFAENPFKNANAR